MPSFVMTGTWQKVAPAGSAVDLQLVSNAPVRILESDTAPDPDADGEVLTTADGHRTFVTLASDLYAVSATAQLGGKLMVLPGAAPGGTAANGVTMPAGGSGLAGWLSGLFSKLPLLGPAVPAASLPVVLSSASAFVDRSGSTSATPGAWAPIAPANPAREYFRLTNTSGGPLYLWDKTGTPAQAGALPLAAGQSIAFDTKVSSAAMQVMSQTASAAFEAAEG